MRTAVPLTPRTRLKTGSWRGCFGFMIAVFRTQNVYWDDGQPCVRNCARVKIAPGDAQHL
jgi:hypothetical protein